MRKSLKKWVFDFTVVAPFFVLIYSALSGYLSSYEYFKYLNSFLIPDTFGYSIFTCIMLMAFYYVLLGRLYCWETKLAVFSIMVMNFCCIFLKYNHFNQFITLGDLNLTYDLIITGITFFIIFIRLYNVFINRGNISK